MKNYAVITAGDRRIKEVVITIENQLKKGRYGSLENKRYSDCFVYILKGETHYTFSDYEFTVSEGQILYLSKNAGYEMNVLSDEYLFVFIDFFFSGDGEEVRKSGVFKPKNKAEAESLFRKSLNLWLTNGKAAQLKLLSLAYSIYSECVDPRECYTPVSVADRIKPAYNYIISNYCGILPADFGRLCGITETHFRRLFKSVYGTTPVKFVNGLRVERAAELLADSDIPISEISGMVGYNDVYYFSRMFKKIIGVSPGAYRKSHYAGEK